MSAHVKAERLFAIKQQMLELLNEALVILLDTEEEERAKSYWWPHIRMALDEEHSYLGKSMFTIQDTVEALEGEDEA
jgi:hypothetical protein